MRTEGQTSKYLLLASVVSIFSVMLALITSVMVWELWMIPIIVLAMISVWCLHIGKEPGVFGGFFVCAGDSVPCFCSAHHHV